MPFTTSNAATPKCEPALLRALRQLELQFRPLSQAARLLPAVTARNARQERMRLIRLVAAGQAAEPRWELPPPPCMAAELRILDHLRRQVGALPCRDLYQSRFDELELELCVMAELGRPKQLRPLSARRFGTGAVEVQVGGRAMPLSVVAQRILERVAGGQEPRVLPAQAERGQPSLSGLMQRCADRVGLVTRVVVDAAMVAGAAAGDHTVYLADRDFGEGEAQRLVVHEVLGHLTAAANGRAQPVRIVEWGTADSFADQEGLALFLEDHYGLLDPYRLRVLAGRVVATDAMHGGATFTETASILLREHGFSAEEAVGMTERAYRGGGVARDAAYLTGFLRVGTAIECGEVTVDLLRAGRLSVSSLSQWPLLMELGLARPPVYRPNFSRSFFSTSAGTTPRRLPPRAAASLIKVELT